MTVERALARRLLETCRDKNTSISHLTKISGVNPSTVYEFLAGRTKCPTVAVIKQLCDGLNMTLAEFFNMDYFSN